MQRTQRRRFRHQQHAGGIAVKTMHQFRESRFRTQRPQPFDDAPNLTRFPAVYGGAETYSAPEYGRLRLK